MTTVVRPSAVARAALRGALDLIAQAGGREVEGYPRDTRGEKMTASHLYNVSDVTEEAGLQYVHSKGQFNCVLRTTVTPGTAGTSNS